MDCSIPGFRVHHQLSELVQTHVHRLGDAIQPSHPLSPSPPPAFNLSQHQGLFQWVNCLHQVPKYCSFSFSISPFNEYSGLISFLIDWFDLLTVQGTLKSLLQHHIWRLGHRYIWGVSFGSVVKNSLTNTRDARGVDSIPGRGGSLEKETAAHSSILAHEIPWTEEARGLQPTGSQRVGHNLVTKQQEQKFSWP